MEERSRLEAFAEHAKDYAETRLELVKLEAAAKVGNVASSIASAVVIGLFGLFTLFFVSVGVAWWIGRAAGNPSMGFFIVAAFYLVVGIVFYVLRNSLVKLPVVNALLAAMHYEEQD